MRENLTLTKLRQGEATIGCWLTIGSPVVAAIMSRCNFDWLVIDTEHGAVGYNEMLVCVHEILATETTPIVRVAWNDPTLIKRTLDSGAMGILVPMVMNAEEAKRAVGASKFPPKGVRSVGGFVAQLLHGDDYPNAANEQILVAVQIEHIDAVKRAKEICDVDGVDVVFVGPNDLAASMGLIGTPFRRNPEWQSAVQAVLEAAKEAGKVAGLQCGTVSEAKERLEQGFRFVAVSSDARLLHQNLCQVVTELKSK
ncbi:MAG: aldolase/citrate lyase family protein [Armatimonadetes bacterium]|nr:aldolase/citrate lyase family protein [Armatimonadota bacterium]MDW8027980.1 aldolase/citrate lyase family protein [Armatimonadota bacterium]